MDNTLLLPIIILVLILALFVLASLNKNKLKESKRSALLDSLQELQNGVLSEELSIRRDSIIKLDNLLSKSLQLYYKNKLSCGENLKNAKKLFRRKDYNEIWEVHKLRNKIVHNDYEVTLTESKNAYSRYKFSINKILK